jgi:hypothetical protein
MEDGRVASSGSNGRRTDAGLPRATERDLALLRVVGEQYAVTLPQLAVLMGRSVHTARWLRDRWRRAGWVESRTVLAARPVFVWLTRSGSRAAGLDYPGWRPTPGLLAHVEAVTDVRLHVAANDPDARWISERDIPTTTAGIGGAHRPDGLIVADDREIAVEVELTQKSRARARAIVCELVARYPAVVYFVADGLGRLIADLAAEVGQGRVEVRGLPEATTPAVRR